MALPNPLTRVQDSRVGNGIGQFQESFLVVPAGSDYPTSGYVISAAAVGFKTIQSVSIDGCNSTALTWNPSIVLPIVQMQASGNMGYGEAGYTSFNFYLAVASTGVQLGASAGPTLGAIWVITVTGY